MKNVLESLNSNHTKHLQQLFNTCMNVYDCVDEHSADGHWHIDTKFANYSSALLWA